jgi:hypothetical protein
MAIMKCPHCGREYSAKACKPLVPKHGLCAERITVCPGSGQVPRNAETDRRPLWKDEPRNYSHDEGELLYSAKCEVCGASPVLKATGMCSPCTMGEV